MKNGLWAALVIGLTVAACGGGASETSTTTTETTGSETTTTTTTGTAASAEVVPRGEATIGDRTTCPVSGEEFTVTDASPHAEHDGRTYYFCCPGCEERFQADPHSFLEGEHGKR